MLSLAIGVIEPCPFNVNDALIKHPNCEVKVRKDPCLVDQPHGGRGLNEHLFELGLGSQLVLEVSAVAQVQVLTILAIENVGDLAE